MEKEECKCSNECNCDEDCNCTEENKCNPNCTCNEDEEHKHDGKCGKDCECHGGSDCKDKGHKKHHHNKEDDDSHDHDDHDCESDDHDCECDDDCDCHVTPNSKEEAFAMYEKAFRQLEDALIKADKEIGKEKARADENEHLARVYKHDLERYKERNKNAQEEYRILANSDTALKLLPLADNFNQALESVKDTTIAKGFAMIFNTLKEIISNLGVEEIYSLNEEFNPDLHECVSKVKAPNKESKGKVARVFKTGYKLKGENGKVLRHSVVEIYE